MPDDKVLRFLSANSALTTKVEMEEPVPLRSALLPALPLKVRQVETFTYQGKQVWLFTYNNGTWERIENADQAFLKSMELFPAGPPKNS